MINNSLPLTTVVLPEVAPGPPSPIRAINAVWFTSIILSLSVAFLVILARQWLDSYQQRVLTTTAPSAQWAVTRQFFASGLVKWHMATFITLVLPAMLHMALALFMAGIAMLVWALDRAVASWLVAMLAILATFYIACTVFPFLYPDIPTSTQLTRGSLHIITLVSSQILPRSWRNAVEQRLQRMLATTQRGPDLDHDSRGRLLREVLLRAILSGSDDACRAAFRMMNAPSDMTRPLVMTSNYATDPEMLSLTRMNLLFSHPPLNLGPPSVPFPDLPTHSLWRSTSTASRLLAILPGDKCIDEDREILRMFANSEEPFLSSTALLLFRIDAIFPARMLFLLLALVRFEALNSNDYLRILTKAVALLPSDEVTYDEHHMPLYSPDEISIVTAVTIVMRRSRAFTSGHLAIAHILACRPDDLGVAGVSPYAVALSRFIVGEIRGQIPPSFPYQPMPLRQPNALSFVCAITGIHRPYRPAIDRIYFGTGSFADGLLDLVEEPVDYTEFHSMDPEVCTVSEVRPTLTHSLILDVETRPPRINRLFHYTEHRARRGSW